MTELTVHLDCGADGHQLVVDVVDVNAPARMSGTVSDGHQTTFPVTPGRHYLVQAVRPDGAVFSSDTVAGTEGAVVHLRSEENIRRVGEAQGGAGAGTARQVQVESDDAEWAGAFAGTGLAAPPPPPLEIPVAPRSWVCLWVLDRSWRPRPWTGTSPRIATGEVQLDVDLPRRVLHALQVGGPQLPTTVVLLPPSERVTVSLRPAPRGEDVVASARTGDEAVESLLAYLTSSQLVAAERVKGPVVGAAEDLVFAKTEDPVGAVVGALFLLRTRRLDLLHDWTRHLADWNPWFPDAAAVRAAHLLAQPSVPRDELRDRLVTAARAGVPVYTESLTWLYEGLRLLSAELADDAELQAALHQTWRYADTCDSTVALTTFRGVSPAEPTFARIAAPAGPAGFARALFP